MDALRELEKWKADFIAAKTPEAQSDHKKRFNAFLKSLSPKDKRAFVIAFQTGAKQAVNEAKELTQIVDTRQKLNHVLDFASMSYIAKNYFGKTRQWLYQKINGSIVNGKPADFTSDELHILSVALSELSDIMKETSRLIARP